MAAQQQPAMPPNPQQPQSGRVQVEPQENTAQKMPSRDPERAQELHDLAQWHRERGDYSLAVARLIEALNHCPDMLAPAYDLGEIYYAERNYQGALDIYDGILRLVREHSFQAFQCFRIPVQSDHDQCAIA